MKSTVWRTVAVLSALLPWSVAVVAQVYESKEKGGVPVFSGTQTEGAKSVDLPPPNVAGPQKEAPVQPLPAPASFSYAQLAILAPAQQGAVHTNTGAFNVQVSVDPALRSGDAFMVTLDGTALPGRYTTANIGLTEQDYTSAADDSQEHSLTVAIVDSNGKVLVSSEAVLFYVIRSTVRRRSRR
jgi:hypothetical protein